MDAEAHADSAAQVETPVRIPRGSAASCWAHIPLRFNPRRGHLDRFHARNHSACSPAYLLSHSAAITNSSVMEQANNRLHAIIPSMRFMRYDVAMHLLLNFVVIHNHRCLESLASRASAMAAPLPRAEAGEDAGDDLSDDESGIAAAMLRLALAPSDDAAIDAGGDSDGADLVPDSDDDGASAGSGARAGAGAGAGAR